MVNDSNSREEFYSKFARRYLNNPGGNDLRSHCKRARVSYNKVIDCISNDPELWQSYHSLLSGTEPEEEKALPLRPLILDGMPPSGTSRNVSITLPNGIVIMVEDCPLSELPAILERMEVRHA